LQGDLDYKWLAKARQW